MTDVATGRTHGESGVAGNAPRAVVVDRVGGRRAGRAMRVIAVFGVVTAVVVTVVGWRFLDGLDRDLDRSLTIGEDASATLTETIDVATEVVDALDEGLIAIERTLEGLSATSDDTSGVAAATAELAASLPDSFEDVDAALATVESLGGAVDGALRTASRLPLGPDYDPDVAFPDAVADLRAAFSPLGDDLDLIATELAAFADGSRTVGADLEAVRAEVARTQIALADSDDLLARYRDAALRAEVLARDGRADVARSIDQARLALVLLAVLVVLSQFVPWWLGGAIAARRAESPVWVATTTGTDGAGEPAPGSRGV